MSSRSAGSRGSWCTALCSCGRCWSSKPCRVTPTEGREARTPLGASPPAPARLPHFVWVCRRKRKDLKQRETTQMPVLCQLSRSAGPARPPPAAHASGPADRDRPDRTTRVQTTVYVCAESAHHCQPQPPIFKNSHSRVFTCDLKIFINRPRGLAGPASPRVSGSVCTPRAGPDEVTAAEAVCVKQPTRGIG